MSHDFDESRTVPDDRLFVRPYVAPPAAPAPTAPSIPWAPPVPSDGRARPTGPAWPQSGPAAFPGPLPVGGRPSGPADAAAAPLPVSGAGGERDSRLPLAVLALLALIAAGVLVLVLDGPEPEPVRAAPPGISVPVLPQRSPDAATGEPAVGTAPDTAPGTEPSSSAGTPSASASASAGPGPAAPRGDKSTPPARPSVEHPSRADDGTLRPGDRGAEVSALQERLYGQGFTYVSVTGVYDERTRRGVAQLQRDRSIKGDPKGAYGPATRAAFG
ncbi:peptidoglycan-binding protein [Streptomyces sp. NPDC058655]|uniref:peptidoglycan-binding domain-containing protein n=1 Tax=Streptomyces sp. NPDC058655 TaxID=3346577 RepID=UPI00364AEAC5